MTRKIKIFDTTLRDGEQSPGCSMNLDEKVQIARQLEKLEVDVVEAGFPVASKGEFEAVQKVARELGSVTVAALSRAKPKDIKSAWEAISGAHCPRIHTFIATSEIHMIHKLSMKTNEVLQSITESVSLACSLVDDVEFSAEDASRSDISFLVDAVATAIKAGATTINLPDTVGYTTPREYKAMFKEIIRQVPECSQICLSAHCHNDLGMAVANSLAAIECGAGQVECTINGIGERAGNASLEEIVMALRVRKEAFQAHTNVNTEQLFPTSKLLSEITHVDVQPNKAIVGANAFAHEAGIHQDGVLKNTLTYEIMTPESVGVPCNNLVLGKHSGRHALREHYRRLGLVISGHDLENLYKDFLLVADEKKTVTQDDLLKMIEEKKLAHKIYSSVGVK